MVSGSIPLGGTIQLTMQYYIREGRKFVAVDRFSSLDDMPEGIWYIHRSKGCHGYTNIETRLAEFPKGDLRLTIRGLQLEEKILEGLQECWSDGKAMSLADAAKLIAAKIVRAEENKLTSRKLRQ